MTASSARVTAGRLFAISDLHLSRKENRIALEAFGGDTSLRFEDDWLIVAGDVGERVEHLQFALSRLARRFARVIWTPGNHDLWCPAGATDRTRGQARYDELVAACRSFGALTPEDPYERWPGLSGVEGPGLSGVEGPAATYIAPLFLLFDYSFRPADVPRDQAIAWAKASGVVAGDEGLLSPVPWPSRDAWCHARCDLTEARLMALPPDCRTILINHWPLRYDLARPPRIPRFSIWSGTTRTEDWAQRFRARAVINGHLHLRTTLARHGVRYDEVSLGYPRDWRRERGLAYYFREILPGPDDRFVPPRDPFRH
jgi:3',5'-cyclic AMP phosphodiesterase CpdA